MTVFTEGRHPAEFILSEASGMRSRDNIILAEDNGVVSPGTVLKRVGAESVSVGTPVFTGDGNGVLTLAAPAFGAGVMHGNYRLICIAEDINAGTFQLERPDGVAVALVTVAVAYDGELKFTIADGAIDFSLGDMFVIPVSIDKTGGVAFAPAQAGDRADAVCIYGGDTTSADVNVAGIVRDAELNGSVLVYHSSVDNNAKRQALNTFLRESGIIVR